MMLRKILFAFALAAPGVASAAQFHLAYTTSVDATSGPARAVDALVTTDDGQFYGGNGYQVLSISGTRGADAISFDPNALGDEIFFPANASGNYVDDFGVDFLAGGVTYNLYKGSGDFAYHEFDGSTGRLVFNSAISLTPVAAVPEPASWALMLGGFGMLGGAMRRSRRTGDRRTA